MLHPYTSLQTKYHNFYFLLLNCNNVLSFEFEFEYLGSKVTVSRRYGDKICFALRLFENYTFVIDQRMIGATREQGSDVDGEVFAVTT